ncbi:MAG: hypothetical protein JWO13_832 [Acidobacteriales bacterium]|nr:hypothetical protein [Terriglobales bacterium]
MAPVHTGQGVNEDAVEAAATDSALESAKAAAADAPGPAQPEAGTRIISSVDSGTKHVKVIIEDAAAIGELVAGATGHEELAKAIELIAKYAGAAMQGAEDASVIVIDRNSILALLKNVKLDPPTS